VDVPILFFSLFFIVFYIFKKMENTLEPGHFVQSFDRQELNGRRGGESGLNVL
jgi:hypothetical protein